MSDEKERLEYEKRLQHRLGLLKKALEERSIRMLPETAESLKRVKLLPDGSFDLNTVDGKVRATALSVEAVQGSQQAQKALSLSEIQNTYFVFMDATFGELFNTMVKRQLTPHQAGLALSQSESTIKQLTKNLPDFLSRIEEFWNRCADVAYAHVADMSQQLIAVFGGDLFPSNEENIASKCGIYTDTIVLPDPFIRSKPLFQMWNSQQQTYYLIKHGLNILQYKMLACADIKPPIVAVLPDFMGGENEKNFLSNLAKRDVTVHACKIFGRDFATFGELEEFSRSLTRVEDVVKAVADPSRLVLDVDWRGSVKKTIETAITEENFRRLGSIPGDILIKAMLGRLFVTNEHLGKAARLHGTPIIDAPTSWQYFVWKMEYDAHRIAKDIEAPALHIVRGLQSIAENQMEWLGRVPPEMLIEIRRTGAINEIRSILGAGVRELAVAGTNDFQSTTNKVLSNIQAAFELHKAKIRELRKKKWKFAGYEIGSWVVVGSLEVAAAATGYPLYGIATFAANQLFDIPRLKDIPKSFKNLVAESSQVRQSPVGLLFSLSRRKRRRMTRPPKR